MTETKFAPMTRQQLVNTLANWLVVIGIDEEAPFNASQLRQIAVQSAFAFNRTFVVRARPTAREVIDELYKQHLGQ